MARDTEKGRYLSGLASELRAHRTPREMPFYRDKSAWYQRLKGTAWLGWGEERRGFLAPFLDFSYTPPIIPKRMFLCRQSLSGSLGSWWQACF